MQESLAFLQKRRAEENATLILNGSKNSVALEAAAKVSSYLTTINVITISYNCSQIIYNILMSTLNYGNFNLVKLFCFAFNGNYIIFIISLSIKFIISTTITCIIKLKL